LTGHEITPRKRSAENSPRFRGDPEGNSVRLPPRRWQIAGVAILAVLVALGVLIVAIFRSTGGPHGESVTIPAGGGITLAGETFTPDGPGRHPLIVMPAGWGATATEYRLLAQRFADRGYVVVAYAQRGFAGSGGAVDFAGTPTQRDASTVIDWALAHTRADPDRIGMTGVSYGAGISLLAAERDPRIKAVVAMSAWTDIDASLVQNGTLSSRTLGALLRTIGTKGRAGAYATELQARLKSDPAGTAGLLRTHEKVSSPIADIAALNGNGTAVMIANGWEDSIFPPAPLLRFYDALTTPKRLELAVGDHTTPELDGLFGRPDLTIGDALAWFDHYLRGRANGIDRADPIALQDVRSRGWHGFTSWPGTAASADLGAPGSAHAADGHAPASWTANLITGTDTAATSGPPQYVEPADYRPPTADLDVLVKNQHALVWSGPAEQSATTVSGLATVRVSVASSAPSVTFFTYLYDVAPAGTGQLISLAPFTATGLTATSAQAVTIDLQPIRWTVPPGDHLALVVDTVDPRYAQAAPIGSTLTLSSTTSMPATLDVPTTN
jgi:putative CocE/NonD family hydrolase